VNFAISSGLDRIVSLVATRHSGPLPVQKPRV